MKFKTLIGNTRTIRNPKKYLVDWDGKSRSKIQFEVKKFLKEFWLKKIVFEEFPVAGTKLSLDLFNANDSIAIEVQGQQQMLADMRAQEAASRLSGVQALGQTATDLFETFTPLFNPKKED